jgi:hypothetical protein
LVRNAEQALAALGCPKINLQIVNCNHAVTSFYERLGYAAEPCISMGKVLAAQLHTRTENSIAAQLEQTATFGL